jgi:hypothetical protein
LKLANALHSLRVFRAAALTDIRALRGCPQLEDVLLEGTGIIAISDLDHNPALTELRLHGNSHFVSLQGARPQTSLRYLVVTRSPILTDVSGVAQLSGLRRLVFSQLDRLSDLSPLALLTVLEELVLENCPAIGSIAPIAKLNNLRSLHIVGCPAVADAEIVQSLTNVEAYINLAHQ